MERQSSGSVPPGAAREQLWAACQAHDASVRRAMAPAGFIFALSVFCGAQTVAPRSKGTGNLVTIIAVVWVLAELLKMSARNHWRPLRSWPKPKWGVTEVTLISVAVVVGGVIGPHLLVSRSSSAVATWGLGAAVTVIVAACLFAAHASYRRRASRALRW